MESRVNSSNGPDAAAGADLPATARVPRCCHSDSKGPTLSSGSGGQRQQGAHTAGEQRRRAGRQPQRHQGAHAVIGVGRPATARGPRCCHSDSKGPTLSSGSDGQRQQGAHTAGEQRRRAGRQPQRQQGANAVIGVGLPATARGPRCCHSDSKGPTLSSGSGGQQQQGSRAAAIATARGPRCHRGRAASNSKGPTLRPPRQPRRQQGATLAGGTARRARGYRWIW